MSNLFLSLLACVYTASLVAGNVFELTKDNFYSISREKDVLMVLFYTPWCGHCQHFKPEYEKAGVILAALNKYLLAKVNCQENEQLCKDNRIEGYPSIKIFSNGIFLNDFNEDRTADGVIRFLERYMPRNQAPSNFLNPVQTAAPSYDQAAPYPQSDGAYAPQPQADPVPPPPPPPQEPPYYQPPYYQSFANERPAAETELASTQRQYFRQNLNVEDEYKPQGYWQPGNQAAPEPATAAFAPQQPMNQEMVRSWTNSDSSWPSWDSRSDAASWYKPQFPWSNQEFNRYPNVAPSPQVAAPTWGFSQNPVPAIRPFSYAGVPVARTYDDILRARLIAAAYRNPWAAGAWNKAAYQRPYASPRQAYPSVQSLAKPALNAAQLANLVRSYKMSLSNDPKIKMLLQKLRRFYSTPKPVSPPVWRPTPGASTYRGLPISSFAPMPAPASSTYAAFMTNPALNRPGTRWSQAMEELRNGLLGSSIKKSSLQPNDLPNLIEDANTVQYNDADLLRRPIIRQMSPVLPYNDLIQSELMNTLPLDLFTPGVSEMLNGAEPLAMPFYQPYLPMQMNAFARSKVTQRAQSSAKNPASYLTNHQPVSRSHLTTMQASPGSTSSTYQGRPNYEFNVASQPLSNIYSTQPRTSIASRSQIWFPAVASSYPNNALNHQTSDFSKRSMGDSMVITPSGKVPTDQKSGTQVTGGSSFAPAVVRELLNDADSDFSGEDPWMLSPSSWKAGNDASGPNYENDKRSDMTKAHFSPSKTGEASLVEPAAASAASGPHNKRTVLNSNAATKKKLLSKKKRSIVKTDLPFIYVENDI